MAVKKSVFHQLILPAALGAVCFLGTCDFFTPFSPFLPYLEREKSIGSIFTSDPWGFDMFVLCNGPDERLFFRYNGHSMITVFDDKLKDVFTGNGDFWGPRFVDGEGNYVIGRTAFSGDFSGFLEIDPYLSDYSFGNGSVNHAIYTDGTVNLTVEEYDSDWNFFSTVNIPIIDPGTGELELAGVGIDTGAGNIIILFEYNDGISWRYAISTIPAAEFPPMIGGVDSLSTVYPWHVFSLPFHLDHHQGLFFTRSGFVFWNWYDGKFHLINFQGQEVSTFSTGKSDRYQFAFSPTGKHFYIFDRYEQKVYRARTWWG